MPGWPRARRATSRQPCPGRRSAPAKTAPAPKPAAVPRASRPRRLHRPAPAAQDGSGPAAKWPAPDQGHPAIPTVFFLPARPTARERARHRRLFQAVRRRPAHNHPQSAGLPDSPPCDRPHLPASHSTPPAKDCQCPGPCQGAYGRANPPHGQARQPVPPQAHGRVYANRHPHLPHSAATPAPNAGGGDGDGCPAKSSRAQGSLLPVHDWTIPQYIGWARGCRRCGGGQRPPRNECRSPAAESGISG